MIIFQTFDRFGLVAYYHLNKEYITELFCINKEKPELNCDGKCYLSLQIAEQQQEREEAPFRDFEKKEMQFFFDEEDLTNNLASTNKENTHSFSYLIIHSQPFYKEDIHPPQV